MKNPFFLNSMTVVVLFLVSACSNPNDQQNMNKEYNHAIQEVTEVNVSQEKQVNDPELNAVYQQYLILTEALVDSDLTKAKIAAHTIEAGAASLKNGEIIKSTASKISSAGTIDDGRNAYAVLSNELISLIKKSGMKTGEIYVDYCPMAQNNQGGYWLSNKKSIQNPYYGESMLTCGEVKEAIL